MSHFARIDESGVVLEVVVAEQDFIDSGHLGNPAQWIQTSYNTYGGQHQLGGDPLRKNFAGIGFSYDAELDAFIPPRPFESWELNAETCLWEPPVPAPDDGKSYRWNEETLSWEE